MRLAEFAPLVLSSERLPLIVDGIPNIEQSQEVGAGIGETLVRGAGGVLVIERPFAGVLNAQAGGNDEQFFGRVLVVGLQEHAAERGINGEARQVTAQPNQGTVFVEGAKFLQQAVAGIDCRGRWRIDEWESLNFSQAKGFHPENDFGQVSPLNLRLGERGPRRKILFGKEPDTNAILNAAAAAFALVGAA